MHSFSSEGPAVLIKQSAVYIMLSLSRGGLTKLRKRDPSFPKPIKQGTSRQAAVYYVRVEIEEWLAAQMSLREAAPKTQSAKAGIDGKWRK